MNVDACARMRVFTHHARQEVYALLVEDVCHAVGGDGEQTGIGHHDFHIGMCRRIAFIGGENVGLQERPYGGELLKEVTHNVLGLCGAVEGFRACTLKDAITFDAFDLIKERVCDGVQAMCEPINVFVVGRFVGEASGEKNGKEFFQHGHHGAFAGEVNVFTGVHCRALTANQARGEVFGDSVEGRSHTFSPLLSRVNFRMTRSAPRFLKPKRISSFPNQLAEWQERSFALRAKRLQSR